jgi:hypothetical protein
VGWHTGRKSDAVPRVWARLFNGHETVIGEPAEAVLHGDCTENFMNSKKVILFVFVFVWSVLVGMSMSAYEGSMVVFVSFAVVFLAMLGAAFYKEFSYSYFFLSILLFLGFWVKLVHHLIFPAPYVEAIGLFFPSPAAWDEVLWVGATAAMALLMARLIWVAAEEFFVSGETEQHDRINVPVWYVSGHKYWWFGVLVLIVFFAAVNAALGIQQVGLAPRTILVFPLNALISWMLNFGLVTVIATFLWWDIHIHKGPMLALFVALIEALFSSVSMLSRGIFIFHVIPQLTAYYRSRKRFISLTLWQMLSMLLVAVAFFAVCFSMVDTLRGYYYRSNTDDFRGVGQQNVERLKATRQEKERLEDVLKKDDEKAPASNAIARAELDRLERELSALVVQTSKDQQELQAAAQSMPKRVLLMVMEFRMQLPAVLNRALSLATNRWIGLEGVMALQAHPDKSFALLGEGLAERYVDGKVPMYQHISKSIYTGMDPNQWKFGSLPGAIAFLYYSGSLWIVFLGMALLTVSLHFFEIITKRVTKNPFLASFYGFVVANTVAQLGVVPRQIVPVLVTLVCGIAFIGFVQSGLAGVAWTRLTKLISRKIKL